MDLRKMVYYFKATLDPNQRQQAEEQLALMRKIISFSPTLVQIITSNEVEMPVKQAAAIYLKREIESNWVDREVEPGEPLPFTIHEQDRALIRDTIVEAVVVSPDVIRTQIAQCIATIVKHDFPLKWTQIVDKISLILQNSDGSGWPGALVCLYQLVKVYEYKKADEKGPLVEAMNLLLPLMYQLFLRLIPDQSEQSVLLQKLMLKIFYVLTQYTLPMTLITKPVFAQWMEVCRQVIARSVPKETNQVDEEYRAELPWWKCKKWALHIVFRLFERYGSPGNVTKEYKEIAEWHLKSFVVGILIELLKVLDEYHRKEYVSPRVLQQSLNYVNQAVSHAFAWKFLKEHIPSIITRVVFPLMSYTEADEEMWQADPYEYIRVKFDIFEDFVSPVTAAQTLLHTTCKKRKMMLDKTIIFILEVLTCQNADPKLKDGALHMVGALADVLLKKPNYKNQLEDMLCKHVFPEFANARGHMRARACWVLHYFSEIKFKDDAVLAKATELTVNALLHDSEIPVKVEASIALQMLLSGQPKVEQMVLQQIRPITLELLKILRDTENDDLTSVMQKIVSTYHEHLMPIAVEICQHLAATFQKVVEGDENSDEKAITAMGLLNTIDTLLSVMESNDSIIQQLQPIVVNVVADIFTQRLNEFYEEALSLVCDLTSKVISPEMWKILELMYQVFESDGMDYFTDMMPSLHNYVTVDTDAFLSNENYVLAMFNMCKTVLTSDAGEDPECHAAKLLEVIILQCKGRIDQCIAPFIELVLHRLMRELTTSELRTMCLQVVIAALYYNHHLLFEILEKAHVPTADGSVESMTNKFIKQWISDADCFLGLHDRKLCVLGLCQLLSLTPNRPPVLNELSTQIMPSLILLFDGLKRAYVAKALEDDEDSSDTESEGDLASLSSDEDDLDNSNDYLESLQEKFTKNAELQKLNAAATIEDEESDDDDDIDYHAEEETALEVYYTPLDEDGCDIDEYFIFKQVLQNIQMTDPNWYQALTGHLTTEQHKALQEVMTLADQRKALRESKKIEQSGGYAFQTQTVPSSFNFGGPPLQR